MADKHYSVQLVNIRDDGTQENLNPITKSTNVKVTPQNNIPETVTDLGKLLNLLGVLAFKNTEINDESVSDDLTWSSNKLYSLFMDIDRRLKIVEDYLAQHEPITINEPSNTIVVPTVCGTVYDDSLAFNSKAAIVDDTVVYLL